MTSNPTIIIRIFFLNLFIHFPIFYSNISSTVFMYDVRLNYSFSCSFLLGYISVYFIPSKLGICLEIQRCGPPKINVGLNIKL